ncbi:hypothetical protein D0U04_25100 [Bacillus clarus]|uniref:Uncharacterized protein n=1 Tax=Bacillus clarus TaxID=2338372 RepID=A0A090YWE2_9BACI|nr:hypothetical protein [Bacillus clarus]KFN03209.1 hypothetical protein DJ93_330 [Bacillus clarus]RFT63468.1 hypothetical protein D0U04_25100 [Bacillus clarus]
MSRFVTLLNEPQSFTFDELPAELQNEISRSIGPDEMGNEVSLFKVRRLNVGGYTHTITYIETDANYYVFTHILLRSGASIKKQTISKTTLSMFQLLHNEDVRLCSQS